MIKTGKMIWKWKKISLDNNSNSKVVRITVRERNSSNNKVRRQQYLKKRLELCQTVILAAWSQKKSSKEQYPQSSNPLTHKLSRSFLRKTHTSLHTIKESLIRISVKRITKTYRHYTNREFKHSISYSTHKLIQKCKKFYLNFQIINNNNNKRE